MKQVLFFIAVALILVFSPACQPNSQQAADAVLRQADSLFAVGLPLPNDTMLDAAIEFYQNQWLVPKEKLAKAYFYRGYIYDNRERYEIAIIDYLSAESLILDAISSKLKADIIYRMGIICYKQRSFNKASDFLLEANSLYEQCADTCGLINSLIYLAGIERMNENYEQAKLLLQEACQFNPTIEQLGTIYQGMGYNYYDAGNSDSTIYYINLSLQYNDDSAFVALGHNVLGREYYKLEQYDSAQIHALIALSFSDNPYVERGCYWILDKINQYTGNLEVSNEYAEKRIDSYKAITEEATKSKVETIILEYRKKEQVRHQHRFTMTVVCTLSSLIIVCILLIVGLRQYKILKKEIQTCEKETKHTIELIRTSVRGMVNSVNAKTKKRYDFELNDIFEKKIRWNVKNMQAFYGWADEQLYNIVFLLRKRYPKLTDREITHCIFIILNLSISAIASLMGVSEYSVSSLRRDQLRKKLQQESTLHIKSLMEHMLIENNKIGIIHKYTIKGLPIFWKKQR